MALLLKNITYFYNYLAADSSDEHVKLLPFMKSPIPLVIVIAAYLLFIYKWGPKYMMNRKPYNLKKTLIIYNSFQMIFCVWYVVKFSMYLPLRNWKCSSLEYINAEMIWGGYLYLMIKAVDLLDTIFFVLKKNFRQVTILHVYHHTSMVVCMWLGFKYYPGGQGVFIPYINTVVHAVMYGYYLLTVYDDKYKKSIWWKKHITQLQLLQFGILTILFLTPLIYDCGYPKLLSLLILMQNAIITILFTNFYYKTYIKKNDTGVHKLS